MTKSDHHYDYFQNGVFFTLLIKSGSTLNCKLAKCPIHNKESCIILLQCLNAYKNGNNVTKKMVNSITNWMSATIIVAFLSILFEGIFLT